MTSSTPPIRMLYFTREEFPTHRVDVDVLFGHELLARGHAIDFVMQVSKPDMQTGPLPWRGRTVFAGPTSSRPGAKGQIQKQSLGLWHDLKQLCRATLENYDAIQVRDKFIIAAVALLVARARGQKFFFWLSFPYPEDDLLRAQSGATRSNLIVRARGKISSWLLYKWVLPRADHAFVQSRQMVEDIAAHGIVRDRMTPVPMGIADADVDMFGSYRHDHRDLAGGVTLGYLGTLNSARRLEVLVEMLALLRGQGIAAKLLLIGDGDSPADRAALEQRADSLGVRDDMVITGFLPRAEALQRAQSADICISPFFPTPVLLSTSPTKLVEYMALGLPVIANDHPEQSLILQQSRAGICVPWGARHFARAVRWYIRSGSEQRQQMGERGRDWVRQNRMYRRIADDVEAKYRELLGHSAA